MSEAATVALTVTEVTYTHPGAHTPAVNAVSATVARGEFLGVLGPNGAGKSTLLRLMAGLIAPARGTVSIDGTDTARARRGELARKVAFVPQQEPVVPGFTAREVVALGRAPHTGWLGTLGTHDHDAVERALARCDALGLADRPMEALSGGEQKRVVMARALAQRAPLVLLDEPVAFLDIRHQLALCELLATGVGDGEFTAVAVLHDLNLAAQFCTRLLFVRDGVCTAHGTIAEVMTYRRIRDTFDAEVYVGVNELNGARYFVATRS